MVFRIEGRFDQPAAIRLRQRLLAEETPRAILDFSHVENLDDATLPLLTVMLTLLHRKGRDVFLVVYAATRFVSCNISGSRWRAMVR